MDDIAKAVANYRRSVKRTEETRAALHAAILRALAEGVSQAELARATGYTRERLRQIAQESPHRT